MRTSKPISTISYNSPEFLRGKLLDWRKAGIIENAIVIQHHAEADEKKDHSHCYIVPARLLQTVDLERDSQEFDPLHPDKPLKMLDFRSSKVSDWILYGMHDPVYLASKGLIRQYHYSDSDFWSTDTDWFDLQMQDVLQSRDSAIELRIRSCVDSGLSWAKTVSTASIPLHMMHNARLYYEALAAEFIESDCGSMRADMAKLIEYDADMRAIGLERAAPSCAADVPPDWH